MENEPKTVRGIDMSSAMRVSFLEQAAMLLASKSNSTSTYTRYSENLGTEKSDAMKVLSSASVKEMREFSYVEQIRPSTQIKRSICKQCKVYLVPDKNGKPAIELRRKRKRMIRRCLNCDHEISYQWNPKYKSRNEKAKQSKVEDLK